MRIPGDRFEFRLPDGAVNPYLLPACVIAAGLEGIDKKLGIYNIVYSFPHIKLQCTHMVDSAVNQH